MDSDRGEIRRWKNLFLPDELTRGLFAFLIEHTDGHLPLPDEFSDSSVNKLDHVVINTNDPDGFIEVYQDIYGIRLALDQTVEKWGGRMLFFRLNKTTIEVIAKKDENKGKGTRHFSNKNRNKNTKDRSFPIFVKYLEAWDITIEFAIKKAIDS